MFGKMQPQRSMLGAGGPSSQNWWNGFMNRVQGQGGQPQPPGLGGGIGAPPALGASGMTPGMNPQQGNLQGLLGSIFPSHNSTNNISSPYFNLPFLGPLFKWLVQSGVVPQATLEQKLQPIADRFKSLGAMGQGQGMGQMSQSPSIPHVGLSPIGQSLMSEGGIKQ